MKRAGTFFSLLVVLGLLTGCGMTTDDEHVFDDPDTYARYARQALQKDQPNLDQAIRLYRNALDLDPEHFNALIGLGDALMYRALALYQSRRKSAQSGKTNGGDATKGGNRGEQRDVSPEQVSKTMKQSWGRYQQAAEVRPESPVPDYKKGRFIFEFKSRDPKSLDEGVRLLKRARSRVNKKEKPALHGKILYYLGLSEVFNQYRKPADQRDFRRARNVLHAYLDFYTSNGRKPPHESKVEDLLMRISETQGETHESGTDSQARNAGADSD